MPHPLRHAAAGLMVAGVCGWMPQSAAADATATIHVLVLNPASASPAVLADAEEAAARVFRRAGIETTWRHASSEATGTGPVSNDQGSVLIVNLMSASMESRVHASATLMGFSVSGGRLANILYGRVESLTRGTASDFGQVLGHVIAHEIAHLLLPPNPHSTGGIMNATLDPRLAARGVLWFSAAEADRMRSRLAALAESHTVAARAVPIPDRIE